MAPLGDASRAPLVILVGATACGKSDLGVALAQALDGEVVNADSRQVYRGLDVGTAKPSHAARAAVRHHLFDVAEPGEVYSAARFRADALAAIASITARGRLPIVVGGTGLYVRALRRGLFAGPGRDGRNHARLAAVAQAGGLPRLFRWLRRVDAECALRVGPSDCQRILRALDVWLQTGVPMSAHLGRRDVEDPLPYRTLVLGLERPRAELYGRIDRRVLHMLSGGLLDEVSRLWATPGFASTNAAKALGYRTFAAHLAHALTLEDAVKQVQMDTRRLAKRQCTWFRSEPQVQWLPTAGHACSSGSHGDELDTLAVETVRGWIYGAASESSMRAVQ